MAIEPKSFLYQLDDATGVATVTLNRPDRLNALTFEVYDELKSVFDQLDTEPGVRCIVLTGSGRAFCSGGDVEDIMGPSFFDYGFGPFRWVCTSSNPADLAETDRLATQVLEEMMLESMD